MSKDLARLRRCNPSPSPSHAVLTREPDHRLEPRLPSCSGTRSDWDWSRVIRIGRLGCFVCLYSVFVDVTLVPSESLCPSATTGFHAVSINYPSHPPCILVAHCTTNPEWPPSTSPMYPSAPLPVITNHNPFPDAQPIASRHVPSLSILSPGRNQHPSPGYLVSDVIVIGPVCAFTEHTSLNRDRRDGCLRGRPATQRIPRLITGREMASLPSNLPLDREFVIS